MKQSIIYMALASLALPLAAHAVELNINNTTDHANLTFKIAGFCSAKLGSNGIVAPHEIKTFTTGKMLSLCAYDSRNCQIDLYASDSCAGDSIATLAFDAKAVGIKSSTVKNKQYLLSGSYNKVDVYTA